MQTPALSDQFETVAEWIEKVCVRPIILEPAHLLHFDSMLAQRLHEMFEIAALQSRMRFSRGTKIIFDTEMNLHRAALKPHAAAADKFGGLS